MSDQALIAQDDKQLLCAFTPKALELKQSALAIGALIGKVQNAEHQRAAVEAQKEVALVLKLAEDARHSAKAPVLEFGRKIDDAARTFVQELKDEQLRLARLVADFQSLENARIRAAEQVRLADERRLQEERRASEQAEIDRQRAESQRMAKAEADAACKARDASSEEARRLAELERMELDRQRKLSEAENLDKLDAINAAHCQAVAALPVATPIRAEGQRVAEEWEFEVTDIWSLARAHPALVKIEPRAGEIKSALKSGAKIAGITARLVTKSGVRATRETRAIEV